MTHPKINIAIDGHSSCGKSTLAKAIAQRLGYTYIDSGAMYRAVTLWVLRKGISVYDYQAVEKELPFINIQFSPTAEGILTHLNGELVEDQIRGMEVSNHVSPIAVIPAVRRAMVAQQQAIGKDKGVAMDGRDIGTVVFPNAEVKIFLTASMDKRVERRHLQLMEAGKETSVFDIRKNLHTRDYIDSTRSDSPLTKTEGAVVIDNTFLSREEQLEILDALVQYRFKQLALK